MEAAFIVSGGTGSSSRVCPAGSTRSNAAIRGHRRPGRAQVAGKRRRGCRLLMQQQTTEVSTEEEIDPGRVEGTSLRIVRYPNPILRAENAEVTVFDAELAKLAREMFKVMYASKGVGLAAPQVGKNVRLMVFNPEGNEKAFLQETVLVNPRIVDSSGKQNIESEGCLSFPGMGGKVKRSVWVKVEAQTLKGKRFKMKLVDWKARIFQHEFDHLDGTLYIDRLTDEGRREVQNVLERLIEDFDGEPAL